MIPDENHVDFNQTLVRWMQLYLAQLLGEPSQDIGISEPIRSFDLDSIDAVTMTFEMESKFNIPLSPELFLDGKCSINDVANKILTSRR